VNGRAFALAASIALAIGSGAGQAAAGDSERAAALAKDASAAYDRGDYRHAAELFEQAHGLDPAASLEVNAAQAWRLAGELGRAADAYALALAAPAGSSGLGKSDRAFAQQKLDELLKSVATLSIDEPRGGTATVAHVTGAAIPVVVHLPAGKHVVAIKNPDGAVVRRDIELGKAEKRTISIVSDPGLGRSPGDKVEAPPPATPSNTAPAAPPAAKAPDEARGMPTVRVVGLVTLGAAAVLGGVTTYFGVRTLDAVDRWDKGYPNDLDAYDEATHLKTATNVLVAATAVTAAAGLVMVVIPAGGGATTVGLGAGRAEVTTTF